MVPLALLWLAGCILLAGLIIQNQVPYADLVLDPNYSSGIPWYMGLVSNLGVLAWTTAAASALLGSWIARLGGRPGASAMLLGGATLTIMLLFDDLFQLHVVVKSAFGLPKITAYVVYGAFAVAWALGQLREIIRTRYGLLLAAATALGLSLVIDQIAERAGWEGTWSLIAEDAAKFLGILAWAQYFTLTTVDIVRSILVQLAGRPTARRGPRSPSRGVDKVSVADRVREFSQ